MARAHRECPFQWEGRAWKEALSDPTVGAPSYYIAVRSTGGNTAAAGATAQLWRVTVAIGLTLPLDENAITEWSHRLRQHTVTPKIPFEVAQPVHFDYHAKYNPSPFVLTVCVSVWFTFLGMGRDAHVQRSALVKRCDHAWIFLGEKSKDR